MVVVVFCCVIKLAQLKEELREKEEEFNTENDRLRQERDEIKERAKVLWMDLENLRIEMCVIFLREGVGGGREGKGRGERRGARTNLNHT